MSFFSPPSKDDKVRLKVAMEAMGLLQKVGIAILIKNRYVLF